MVLSDDGGDGVLQDTMQSNEAPQRHSSYDAPMGDDNDASREDYQARLARAKTLEQLGLKLNDKLEVRWYLLRGEETDETSSESKWWGARLVEQDPEEPRRVTLLYDAAEGFEETRSCVLFLSEVSVYDIEEDGELRYRREGELMDTTDCEKAEADVVTFEELVEDAEEEGGSSEEEMKKLPHEVQIQVAERFSQFKSGLIDFLREKTEERGPDALINANDIADFVSKMKGRSQKPPP